MDCLVVVVLFMWVAIAPGVCTLAASNLGRAAPRSSISYPFEAHAGVLLSNSTTMAGSASSALLNSSNGRFALVWVATSNHKYLLSIVYVPVILTSARTEQLIVGSSTGPQQVWVANRNEAVNWGALLLMDAHTGTLSLQDTDQTVVWSTGGATATAAQADKVGAVALTLQDHGNLVLVDSRGHTVWQSFDHPSDTLLPGQEISTGTQVIASVSFNNVSEGKYSVMMEAGGLIMYVATPTGPLAYHVVGFSSVDKNNTVDSVQHTLCARTSMTYSSGGGHVTISQEPSDMPRGCNESFDIPVGSNENNTDVFFRLDPDGNFRTYVYRLHYGWGIDQEIFSGSLYCALPGKCGEFGVCSSYGSCSCPVVGLDTQLFHAKNPSDPSSGCVLSRLPNCTKGANNYFVELKGVSYFANDFTYQSTSTREHCTSACASSCNCSIAFYQEKFRSCYHYEYVMSIQKVTDAMSYGYVKVGNDTHPADSSNYTSSARGQRHTNVTGNNKMIVSIMIMSAFIAVVCLVGFTLIGVKIRKKLADMDADDAFLESLPGLPTRFSFKELKHATGGFTKRLGSGGFGTVYEGNLGDGSRVAVKRLEGARQGQKEFHAEVATLGSINHLNLVRLRGFCMQRSQCLLVYDHVAHGSLDSWLFSGSRLLDWPTRYNIALDTARGLAFLHEESRERIVHLDIKPQNILLDENFVAKLSDFGLSKLIDRSETDVVTNMRGTPGYVAPEWLLQAAVTGKSDVYSYGMVLLELVSGKRNLDLSRNTFWYYPAWAVMMVEEGKMMDIVDEKLKDDDGRTPDVIAKEVERVIKVAMWCIQEDPNIRPCMTTVVRILEGHTQVQDPPSLLEFAIRIFSAGKLSSSSSILNVLSHAGTSEQTASTHLSNSVLSGPR